jgi:ureidoacrylate peracid hydrolase
MTESNREITIEARATALTLDPSRTAVIVVDMQNDFGTAGGMFARGGVPIEAIQAAVEPTARVLAAARSAGMKVVYLKMQFEPDLSNAGPPDAPNRLRHVAFGVGTAVDAPDGTVGYLLIRDTWNTEIVSELAPEEGDVVVPKHRFSGFFETKLDEVLKGLGIETLVFTGCTTSVCVESTLRDAFFRDYKCLLLSDCTAEPVGSDLARTNYEATLLLVERLFGWVTESRVLLEALTPDRAGAAVG